MSAVVPDTMILFSQGRYIAVAASLTGGNALAAFVRMIQLWCMELGCNVPQEKIWNTALAAGMREMEVPSMVTVPTIFGERHCPDQKGSVTNINQVDREIHGSLFDSEYFQYKD